jgi:hypothetical protein
MNGFSHEHFFDPQILDRLVDGELAEIERREVLQTLERQPDGWRQCALAFLEAQSWGEALTQLARQPDEAARAQSESADSQKSSGAAATALTIQSERSEGEDGGNVLAASGGQGSPLDSPRNGSGDSSPRSGSGDRSGRNTRWLSFLALAGSLLVTFSLGMYAQQYLRTSPNVGELSALTQGPGPAPKSGTAVPVPAVAGSPLQLVDLSLIINGRRQQVRVPAVDNQFAAFFAQPQVPTLSAEMQAMLTRMGGQLQFKRDFVTVPLGNNQHAIVPIDRVEIVPVRTVQ